MATRSHIAFYERPDQPLDQPSILLYRHSDGYPSAVLPDILPFLQWFDTARGLDDVEYAAARLLQHLGNLYDQETVAIAREHGTIPEETPFTGTLGYGICPNAILHSDIEFLYAVGLSRNVKIYRHLFPFEDDRRDFARLGTVDLRGKTVYTPQPPASSGSALTTKPTARPEPCPAVVSDVA